jgi:hypothetical protein
MGLQLHFLGKGVQNQKKFQDQISKKNFNALQKFPKKNENFGEPPSNALQTLKLQHRTFRTDQNRQGPNYALLCLDKSIKRYRQMFFSHVMV